MPGIVVHASRSVYWPVPKNACSAIKARICELEGIDPGTNVHMALFEKCGVKDYPEYRAFAVSRNPYSRIYSLWRDKIIENDKYNGTPDPNVFSHYGDLFKFGIPFNEFIHLIVSIPYEKADPHFALQTKQIPHRCGVVRFEHMQPLMLGLFHNSNVTKNHDYKQACAQDDLCDLIYQHYKEDFIRFNYSGDLTVD